MKSILKEEQLTELIKKSIKHMCKTSLDYNEEIEIQGTLGVTIDKTNMFLISVNDVISFENSESSFVGEDKSTIEEAAVENQRSELIAEIVSNSPQKASRKNLSSKLKRKISHLYKQHNSSVLSEQHRTTENVVLFEGKRRKSGGENSSTGSFVDAFNNFVASGSQKKQEPVIDPVSTVPLTEVKLEKEEQSYTFTENINGAKVQSSPGPKNQSSPLKNCTVILIDDHMRPKTTPKRVTNLSNGNNISRHHQNNQNSNVLLPEFSSTVKKKLKSNESKAVWNKMIQEAAEYYSVQYPNILGEKEEDISIQEVAKCVHKAYPDVGRNGNGPNKWSKFACDLQSRISLKTKLVKEKQVNKKNTNIDDVVSTFPARNSSKPSNHSPLKVSPFFQPRDKDGKIKNLKQQYQKLKENENSIDKESIYQEIIEKIKKTFLKRRHWIEDMSDSGSVQAILNVFPVFKDSEFLNIEMELIKGHDTMVAVQKKCENLFEQGRHLIPIVDAKADDKFDIQIFQFMEEETSLPKRGNLRTTESIITHYKDATDEFIANTKKNAELKESPSLLVFTCDGQIKDAVILTDGEQIQACSSSFRNSVLSLLYVYYIAWIDYPREYSQILGLFQQNVLGEKVPNKKSNLVNFQRKLQKVAKN